ncbi:hypothetical protein [Hymenobacter nivis]|uniref:Uncharacterized protein n=1 Tax=Hymenobacter nivis TaxID=1850093 RepID=A0A2Z3GKC1_9BACT|nr:hypothetical protein [Hymenobacter nivis]AWM31365.1 hypothetical protein DDQ68_00320 [Hymenobacter nivis]
MLDTNTAEAAVMALLEDQATRLDNPAKARMDFARDIVAAFAALIRSGTVTGTVSTTGTAAAQAGPLLNGTIS